MAPNPFQYAVNAVKRKATELFNQSPYVQGAQMYGRMAQSKPVQNFVQQATRQVQQAPRVAQNYLAKQTVLPQSVNQTLNFYGMKAPNLGDTLKAIPNNPIAPVYNVDTKQVLPNNLLSSFPKDKDYFNPKTTNRERLKLMQPVMDRTMVGLTFAGPTAKGFNNASGKFSALADKKPRFEISDRQAYLRTKKLTDTVKQGSGRLEDILDHQGLYRQYPELRKLRVRFKDLGEGTKGSFNPKTYTLSISPKLTQKEMRSTLLHEIQHSIQTKEGFARGAEAKYTNRETSDEINKLENEIHKVRIEMGKTVDDYKARHPYELDNVMAKTPELDKKLDPLHSNFRTLTDKVWKLKEKKAYENYRSASGEIEARDVQAREALSPQQRRYQQPYASQGIPLKDQIVKMDDGITQSKQLPKELEGLVKQGGHVLDKLPKNYPTENIRSGLFGKDIKFDLRDLQKQTAGKLRSNYWLEKIKNGERPPVLIDLENGALKVKDGNHRLSSYFQTGSEDIPVIFTPKAKNFYNQAKGVQSADMSMKLPVSPQLKVVNGKLKVKMTPVEGAKLQAPTSMLDNQTPQVGQSAQPQSSQIQSSVGGAKAGAVLPQQPQVQKLGGIEDKGSPDNLISTFKEKASRLYTEAMDRYHPISKLGKQAGQEDKVRRALTGHYGAGSTATYHVDYELAPILKEQNVDALRKVAIAQRDAELLKRGIQGSNQGVKLDALKKELGNEQFSAVQGTLKKLYTYQDDMVKKYLVDTGVMSKKGYEAMKSKNEAYIPFKRVMDEVDSFLGTTPQNKGVGSVASQGIIKGIKGSKREIVDPLESIIENTYKIVGLGRRQQVAQTLVNLKSTLPKGMIEEIKGPIGNKPNIALFENGKVKHYSAPLEVVEAAKGLSEEGLNTLIKILAAPTKVLRATATGINPEFAIPNVTRDVQSAFVNAGLNPVKWLSGLAHMVKEDDVYRQFLKEGGLTSRISLDKPYLKSTVADLTGKGIKIKDPRGWYPLMQKLGQYSEQPTRIAVFQKKLKEGLAKGLSQEEAGRDAAYWAQEATVNFARRGAKTQSANAIYAFLNARAQGLDRLVRSAKSDPKGVAVRVGLITQVPAMALYAYNRGFEAYNDSRIVTEYDKRDNFIFMLSDTPIKEMGGAQFIKIPKGDVGRLANPTEEFMAYMDGKGGNIYKAFEDSILGLSPLSNTGDIIPTAIRPIAENAANHSYFTGREIVPEYKKDYPAADQTTDQTAPIYNAIGERFDKSPAKMQALVEGYGTGIAKMVGQGVSKFVPDEYKSDKYQQGATINTTPILRRFMGGEKKSAEEQEAATTSGLNSIMYQINDIKSGIKKGRIDKDRGLQKINELMDRYKTKTPYPEERSKLEGVIKGLSDLFGGKVGAEGQAFTPETSKPKTITPTTSTDSSQMAIDIDEEGIKNNLKFSNQNVQSIGGKLYIKGDDGDIKTVDLGSAELVGNAIQQAKQAANAESRIGSTGVNAYFSTKLPQADKETIYKALGTNAQDVEFKALASLADDQQASVLFNLLKERSWKTDKVNAFIDKEVLTNSVVGKMEDQGLINEQQSKDLKAYIKNQNVKLGKVAASKGKKPKKLKIPKLKAIKVKYTKLKIKIPKPKKYKSLLAKPTKNKYFI